MPWWLPIVPLLFVVLLTACSEEPEPSARAAADTGPSASAAAPSTGQSATPTATAVAGTALERSGEDLRGWVDVGGYRLYLECTGSGAPTVVLEAGFGGDMTSWTRVRPKAADITRICAYDRANRGRSDRGPEVNTSERMVADLRTVLATAGITGPYVMVAQSFGGYNALLYAGRYPAEVAGLVLVDSVHYDSYAFMVNDPVLDRVDVITSRAQVRAARPLPDVPLIVLTRGRSGGGGGRESEEQWQEGQRDLARQVPRGRQVVVADAGHNIHTDKPDAVIDAIREVVETVRAARWPQLHLRG